MPRTPQQAQRRQRQLQAWLAERQSVSVAEAARRLGVSAMTVRRDLRALEQSGQVLRCYGGAVAAQRVTLEFAFDQRHRCRLTQKRRIGQAAAARVEPGQTVFLDTGTTTAEIARALAGRPVACRVVTSSLVVASALWGIEPVELILLGGRVRRGSPDLAGPGTELLLERLGGEVAFLGSDGVDVERGCFAGDAEAARVAERMAAAARRVVVVADATKLAAPSAVRYLEIEQMDELITDTDADAAVVRALRRRGVTVTLA